MSVSKGGGTFLPEVDSAGEASTQNTVISDDIPSSPPAIPPRSLARKPTPRPSFFASLAAAYEHVYRNQSKPSSRDASGDITHGRVGDESELEDMSHLTSAFGRSLTTSAQPSEAVKESRYEPKLPEHVSSPITNGLLHDALPAIDPENWMFMPKPLKTSRTASSATASSAKPPATSPINPPCVSGSSVDGIIDQYADHSSSAAQIQNAVHGSTSEVEHCAHQHDNNTKGKSRDVPTHTQDQGDGHASTSQSDAPRSRLVRAPRPYRGPPRVPLPADPPYPRPDTPRPIEGTPCVDYSDNQHPLFVSDAFGRDGDKGSGGDGKVRSYGIRVVESTTASEAESGLAQLTAPPERMYSARRPANKRCSFRVKSTASSSPGYWSDDGSEDDHPFKYDDYLGRSEAWIRPSKERAVSACLRKVSGLQRESRASIYSQDGTPSKTFGRHCELFGGEISPAMQQSVDDSHLHFPSRRHGDAPRSPYEDESYEGEGGGFYNSNAIKSRFAEGNPNEVKILVNKNLFGGAQKKSAETSMPLDENQQGWELLRRQQELQNNRLTGNTDD